MGIIYLRKIYRANIGVFPRDIFTYDWVAMEKKEYLDELSLINRLFAEKEKTLANAIEQRCRDNDLILSAINDIKVHAEELIRTSHEFHVAEVASIKSVSIDSRQIISSVQSRIASLENRLTILVQDITNNQAIWQEKVRGLTESTDKTASILIDSLSRDIKNSEAIVSVRREIDLAKTVSSKIQDEQAAEIYEIRNLNEVSMELYQSLSKRGLFVDQEIERLEKVISQAHININKLTADFIDVSESLDKTKREINSRDADYGVRLGELSGHLAKLEDFCNEISLRLDGVFSIKSDFDSRNAEYDVRLNDISNRLMELENFRNESSLQLTKVLSIIGEVGKVILNKEQLTTNHQNMFDLFFLDNSEFLSAIYKTILGRSIDQNGQQYYLKRLEDGKSRTSIIYQIASSEEAKAREYANPELRKILSIEKKKQHWFFGLFRPLFDFQLRLMILEQSHIQGKNNFPGNGCLNTIGNFLNENFVCHDSVSIKNDIQNQTTEIGVDVSRGDYSDIYSSHFGRGAKDGKKTPLEFVLGSFVMGKK